VEDKHVPTSLSEALRSRAIRSSLPKGGTGDIIGIEAIADLAETFSLAGHIIEAEALKLNIIPSRYLRNMDSITTDEQIKLLEASIAQVGLGGLGGTLLEAFVRTGIGRIHAADGDSFEESNLNRQALSSPDNLGHPKAHAAIARTESINPSVTIDAWNEFLTPERLSIFLDGQDLAIDALGGLTTRLALQHAAAEANIPLVTGALAGWTGYVSVVLPGHSGPADIMGLDNAAEEKLGCPAPAVMIMASLMAAEAVKILSGTPSNLNDSMLIIDLKTLSFEKISL